MIVNKALKKLVEDASLNSILGGGISVPFIHLKKTHEHIELSARIPGMEIGKLHVQIQNEKMIIYRDLDFEKTGGKREKAQLVIHSFPLTEEIDSANVRAYPEGNTLKIILPLVSSIY